MTSYHPIISKPLPGAMYLIALAVIVLNSMTTAVAQSPPPATYGNPSAANSYPGNFLPEQPSARLAATPQVGNASGVEMAPAADVSQAADSSQAAEEGDQEASIQIGNIVSIIREGGLLMIPILLCSIVLLVFVIERAMFLRKGKIIPRPFVRGVIEQLEQQQLDRDEALALCEENDSPISELFASALKKWGRPAVEVEQAVLDAGERVVSQLRKYLRLFNAISNLTPLLGLLGTVLGMIDAFNSIAQANAMGRPELLASGIGAALLTTAAGLCVAIPAYAAYAFFVGRTERLTLEMDLLAQNIVELVSAEALQAGRSRGRAKKAA